MKNYFKISQQFLSGVPIKTFDWQVDDQDWQDRNSDFQYQLLNATICHPLAKKFRLSRDYQRAFLKHVINKIVFTLVIPPHSALQLESAGTEILDEFYEDLAALLKPVDSIPDYWDWLYLVNDDLQIVIQECTALISEGTTGLVTWPAAKALAEFCAENCNVLNDRKVLELGCGLGFCGIFICKQCSPRNYTFSDFHTRVLDALRHNLNANLNTDSNNSTSEAYSACSSNNFYWKTTEVSVVPFHWDDVEQLNVFCNEGNQPDVILAADVIYDTDIMPSFFNVLVTMLRTNFKPTKCSNAPTSDTEPCAYVALTERNLETVSTFFRQAEAHKLLCTEQRATKKLFYYDQSCPVKVFKLVMRNQDFLVHQ